MHYTPFVALRATSGAAYTSGVDANQASETLRERTRRAVQQELLEAAQELFQTFGYENVTVEQIAAAAGISRRSLFRYFGSKEALLLGKFERQGEEFAAQLAQRPLDEPVWISLQRMFDGTIAYMSDPIKGEQARQLQAIINSSDSLRAGYAERMQRAQEAVVDALMERATARGESSSRLEVSALASSGFGCLSAAYAGAEAEGLSLAQAFDAAMRSVARASQASALVKRD